MLTPCTSVLDRQARHLDRIPACQAGPAVHMAKATLLRLLADDDRGPGPSVSCFSNDEPPQGLAMAFLTSSPLPPEPTEDDDNEELGR